MELRSHDVVLENDKLRLRPMTEDDWIFLLGWNNDPDVLYIVEGGDIDSYSLSQVQKIYRTVSQTAYCFIIEYEGREIGECWLQKMNNSQLKEEYWDLDNRRIALMIGEKDLWGQGIGGEVIELLTNFAVSAKGCDQVFALIPDHNHASVRAFEKSGYVFDQKIEDDDDSKASYTLFYVFAK